MSAARRLSKAEGAAARQRHEEILRAFEEAWRSGRSPILEEYVPTDPDERAEVLVELVHLDLEYRIKGGEAVNLKTYVERFPELAENAAVFGDLRAAAEAMRRRASLGNTPAPNGSAETAAPVEFASAATPATMPEPPSSAIERRELFTLWREEILVPLRQRARRNAALAAILAGLLVAACVLLGLMLAEREQMRRDHERAVGQLYFSRLESVRAELRARDTGWWGRAHDNLRLATEMKTPQRDPAELRDLAAQCLSTEYPCFQQYRHLNGDTDAVTATAFFPDGQTIVTGDIRGNLSFWSVDDGRQLARLPHDGSITSLCISPNGMHMALGSGNSDILIWKLDLPPPVSSSVTAPPSRGARTLQLGVGAIVTLHASADVSMFAAGCEDGSVYLIQAVGDEPPRLLCREAGPIKAVAFRPGAAVLAIAAAQQPVRFRDLATGVELHTQEFGNAPISMAFSADGMTLAVADGDSLGFLTAAVAPGAVAAAHDHVHAGDLRQILCLNGVRHDHGLFWLTVAQDGLKLWRQVNETTVKEIAVATCDGAARCASVSPDGSKVVAAYDDGQVRIWDLSVPPQRSVVSGGSSAVAFLGRKLINPGYVFDFSDGMNPLIQAFGAFGGDAGHRDAITRVTASPDGRWFATGSRDRTVKLWDSRTLQMVHTFQGHSGPVESVSFSADSKYLVSAAGEVIVWETAARRKVQHFEKSRAAAFHPKKPWLVFWSDDNWIRTWGAQSDRPPSSAMLFIDEIRDFAFCADGRRIAAGTGSGFRVWEIPEEREFTLQPYGDRGTIAFQTPVRAIAYSPDGRILAAADDDRVTLLDGETHARLVTLRGIDGQVGSLAFSSDGNLLAAGYVGRPTMVWDLGRLRKELATLGLDW